MPPPTLNSEEPHYLTHTHQRLTRDTVRPARPLLGCPGKKLALLARFWGTPVQNSPCSP